MAIGLGYWEIGSDMDSYPTDMTNTVIRRVQTQSGVVRRCEDCTGEQLKKKRKERKNTYLL